MIEMLERWVRKVAGADALVKKIDELNDEMLQLRREMARDRRLVDSLIRHLGLGTEIAPPANGLHAFCPVIPLDELRVSGPPPGARTEKHLGQRIDNLLRYMNLVEVRVPAKPEETRLVAGGPKEPLPPEPDGAGLIQSGSIIP